MEYADFFDKIRVLDVYRQQEVKGQSLKKEGPGRKDTASAPEE